MWRTSHEATIRSITGNGLNKTLAHTMTIPNSYDTQTNLTADQVAEIQELIGRNDGKTYQVNYTRKITVYTPASMSYNGREIVHDTFDGNNASEIEDCVSRWSWNSSTVSAIRQAAKSTLTFTTTEVTDFIARWIDTTVHEQLYVKNLSGETISGSQNKYVSVSYSDFPDYWNYTYDYLEYTGASSGTSTSDSFSRYVTTSTEPLTITFYCHSDEEETEPETDWETEPETEPETDDYYEDEESLSITVYVRDAETSALLSSAYVTDDDWYGGYTNRYGYVKFYDPESGGRYKFTASKSGYYSNTGSVRASASNPDAMLTIYLTPIETEEEEILGDVMVYVRDNDTNAVISGASVGCGGTTKTTNSSGYTTFYDFATGRYTIVASKSGYQSGSGTVSVTSSGTQTITIYLTPIPPTTGNITVTVRNSQTNAVISGASVTAGGYSGTTNSGGTVTFSSLPLGNYRITASKSGYSTGTTNTTVSSTTPSQNITIYLTPIATTGTVTVTVRDADTNAVIPGAGVSNGRGYGTTTSSGTITFGTLSFDTYTFTASKTGYISGSGTATISSGSPNKSITIYLEKEPTYDVGITANAVNGTVYRGSTIMVAAKIEGDATLDCTPTTPLTVTMQATRNGGSVFDTQTKTAICPKNKTNLVWFAVEIPTSGYSRADVSFRFEVELPSGYTDSQTSDNTSVQTVTTYVLPDRSVPDASFELTPPATFTHSAYKTTNHPELTWQVWEWNGGFVEKTYQAQLTSTARLTPDATAVWSKDDGRGNWTTRSGYGLNTNLSVSLTGVPTDMFTGNAKVNAYYPEFGYTTDSAQSNMLYRASETPSGYSAAYAFPEDEDSISGGRMHKTPIWFPDGDYSVKYKIYDLWTPAGMLTGSTYALVKIQGSMYDDYYTQRQ